jgi:RNA polymerase sigma-70 factor (ECF subfamily)
LEGFKYKEIADELDIPIGTVKSRVFQARKVLSHQLKK